MEDIATLNIRLPRELKENGGRVLKRRGVSTSKAVRKLYEYLEQTQEVPEWMLEEEYRDEKNERRQMLRAAIAQGPGRPSINTSIKTEDYKRARSQHLASRHDFSGVRE